LRNRKIAGINRKRIILLKCFVILSYEWSLTWGFLSPELFCLAYEWSLTWGFLSPELFCLGLILADLLNQPVMGKNLIPKRPFFIKSTGVHFWMETN
jgi:hypothetical protein